MRMQERADRRLRAIELGVRRVRRHQPEGQRMAPGVIADPMTLGVCALGERAVLRTGDLLANDKERRLDVAPRQDVEHQRRHIRRRTVVEGKREVEQGLHRRGSGGAPTTCGSSPSFCRRPAVCHTMVRRSIARAKVSNRIDEQQDHHDCAEHVR